MSVCQFSSSEKNGCFYFAWVVAQAAKDNPEFETRISQDKVDGMSAGVTGTPTFFVNGKMLTKLGGGSLIALIESELEGK